MSTISEARAAPDVEWWPAPTPDSALDATVEVPGSKSLTNRQLVLAALGSGPSDLRAPLRSRDTDLMAAALASLGAQLESHGPDLHVTPGPSRGDVDVDCGLAGTVMRFVPPVAALASGEVRFDGDPAARVRPMAPVLRALRDLGVAITPPGADRLPFTVHGSGRVHGGLVHVDASASSQFISGLLLSAPRFDDGIDLRHVGATLPSMPHVEMTVQTLRERGVAVSEPGAGRWVVEPGPIAGGERVIEPDLSNAGPFLAAALAVGGTVRVPRWPVATTQGGDHLRGLLTAMGAEARLADGALHVTGTGEITGIDVDLHAAGELVPTIAALAALAETPSRLRGVAHLRGHETDRLAALVREITRLGGDAEELADGIAIRPARLRGGRVRTYHDHRIATFAAIIGLRVPGVLVEDVATTAKTLPEFTTHWTRMLGQVA